MAKPRWVTVHEGTLWDVDLLQGLLDAEGFLTYSPDRVTKQVDPFITGGSPLLVRLQVPEDAARAAAALIAAHRQQATGEDAKAGGPAGAAASGEDAAGEDAGGIPPLLRATRLQDEHDEDDEEDEEDEDDETPAAELEGLARRTRWGALLIISAPYAILTGLAYLSACKEHGARARHHGLTVAALALAFLTIVAIAYGIWHGLPPSLVG